MTTYADILKNSEQITDLVTQFKYSNKIKIKYDLPDGDSDDAVTLYFIVSENPGVPVSSDHTSYLKAKLADLLQCEVHIIVEQRIPELGRYDIEEKCALLSDEVAIKKIIYRVQNAILTDETVEESSLATIDFKDIVCRNIPERDKWLQSGLIGLANQYLEENKSVQKTPTNPTSATSATPPKKYSCS